MSNNPARATDAPKTAITTSFELSANTSNYKRLPEMVNTKLDQYLELNPVDFLLRQVLMVNPFAFPLWLAGLGWLFFGREGRRYRVLGCAFLVTFAGFMVLHGKD